MPTDQFVLGCWFLAMFGMGFIFGLLAMWWVVIEVKEGRWPGKRSDQNR